VTFTVEGSVVTGQATFERELANVRGTVQEDGSFSATVGFGHLTGKFAEHMFAGTFNGFGCAWKVMLKMKNP